MSDIYKFIMDDISFAIDNLPDQTYSESKGRWTKNAAKAYKARMILFTAYDEEGNMITNKMTEAKTLLGEIKGYALANDFSDNFNDLKQESSPEIMMSIKFLAPNTSSSADMWYAAARRRPGAHCGPPGRATTPCGIECFGLSRNRSERV